MAQPSASSNDTPFMDDAARKAAMRVIFLTVFLDLLGFGIIIPQLAVYASQFGATPVVVGVLASTYSAMSFLSTPLWGRLSDRVGRRPVMLYSVFGTALGYVIFAFAHSLPLLFLSRVVDGVTAGNISTAQAYISDITPPKDRAKTLGMFGAVFGVGFALGPMIGALLSQLPAPWGGNLGIGLFTAALSFINWAMAVKRLPETLSPEIRRQNQHNDHAAQRPLFNFHGFTRAFQLPGLNRIMAIAFFATLAFATLQGTYTLFLIKQYTRPAVQNYIRTQPQQAIKDAQREIVSAKTNAGGPIIGAGEEGAAPDLGGENEAYPKSLGGDFDFPQVAPPEGLTWRRIEKLLVRSDAATTAAWIFASIGIVSLLTQGALIEPLKKRFGEVNLIISGTVLMALGLALVPFPKHIAGEFPVMALLAFGNSIATPILTALVSELSPENERGEMIGVFQSVGSLGRIFGPNVGGSLFMISAGAPYWAGALIMMISFLFALSLRGPFANRRKETVAANEQPTSPIPRAVDDI